MQSKRNEDFLGAEDLSHQSE